MKLDVKGMAITLGLVWGAAVLVVGIANLIWPNYGQAFLELVASIYPGYTAGASVGQLIVGTLYGLVDGAVGGAVIAWLYNLFAGT
ncbi:MAG: hypothetical protein O7B27_00535 [Gammaproteobacteria bacterium]|jgi:hypothetical protein|nr:hypothetical protein [Pseudomonadota bacterium]MCZ6731029.1 hypothetical protein [Gammaproteobacteria bacterium]